MRVLPVLLGVLGCNEYTIQEPPPVPTAEPPGATESDVGDPPDWASCTPGYLGEYFNLPADHPDLLGPRDTGSGDTGSTAALAHADVDWFSSDYATFSRFDASLDHGSGWWPVDDGLSEDPAYFSGVWRAWLRVYQDGPAEVVVGASTDLWIDVGDETLLAHTGRRGFEPEVVSLDLEAGQLPVVIRYAHRGEESGLRVRFVGDGVDVCPGRYD